MIKARTIILTLIAALALTAAATTTASAKNMSWFVNGTEFHGTETLQSKAIIDENATLNVPGLSLQVTCTGLSGQAQITALERGESQTLNFEGCSEISPSTCKLSKPTIEGEPIISLQVLALLPGKQTEQVFSILHPKQNGGPFATIKFEGSCPFAGEQSAKGLVKIVDPTALSEESLQLEEGLGSSEGNNSLIIDGNKGFIEHGKILLGLTSGARWSFHE
jgi:hypothetical protein